jgi:hypothetical protein
MKNAEMGRRNVKEVKTTIMFKNVLFHSRLESDSAKCLTRAWISIRRILFAYY